VHRTRYGEPARTDATLYIDECHNFRTLPSGLEEMFAEARGYRLSLVLAPQHLSQLTDEVRAATSGSR
jgi:type IV secretory pathway TraG/TraD family ATPase VirD4